MSERTLFRGVKLLVSAVVLLLFGTVIAWLIRIQLSSPRIIENPQQLEVQLVDESSSIDARLNLLSNQHFRNEFTRFFLTNNIQKLVIRVTDQQQSVRNNWRLRTGERVVYSSFSNKQAMGAVDTWEVNLHIDGNLTRSRGWTAKSLANTLESLLYQSLIISSNNNQRSRSDTDIARDIILRRNSPLFLANYE